MQAPSTKLLGAAIAGAVIMVGAIAYGFLYGDFGKEGGDLISMPWGVVTLIDLSIGFAIFSLWIFWREKNLFIAICWTAALILLGNLTACVYLIVAFVQSKGNGHTFWCGTSRKAGSN